MRRATKSLSPYPQLARLMSYDLGVLNLQGKKKKGRKWVWVGVGVAVVVVIAAVAVFVWPKLM